jgi:sulfide:quinone oxidoreductase
MYLAESYFRKQGIRDKTNVLFATPGTVIFGVPEFAKTLTKVIKDRDILFQPFFAPIQVDGEKQEITFKYIKPEAVQYEIPAGSPLEEELLGPLEVKIHFDMLHLAPPQTAPKFIQDSDLAIKEGPGKGWVDVDMHTMQHKRFPNVFCIEDRCCHPKASPRAGRQSPSIVTERENWFGFL